MAKQIVSKETVNQKSISLLVGDVKDMKTKSSANVCQLFQHNGTASANSATTLSQPNMRSSNTELPVNDNLNIDINNDHRTKKYDISNNASSSTNIEELSKCHEQNAQLLVSDDYRCSSLGNNQPNEINDENDLNLDLPNEFVSEQHNDFINQTLASNIGEDDEDMEWHDTINQSRSREQRQNPPPQSLESYQQEDLNSDDELKQSPITSTGDCSASLLTPETLNESSLQVSPTHHQNAIKSERQIDEQSVRIKIDQETEIVRQQLEKPTEISNEEFKQRLNGWNNQNAQRVNRTNRTQELNRRIYLLKRQYKPAESKPLPILPEHSNNQNKTNERNVYFFWRSNARAKSYRHIYAYITELIKHPDNVTQKIKAKDSFLLKTLEQKGLKTDELVECCNKTDRIFKVLQPEFFSFVWAFLQKDNKVWCWKNLTRSTRSSRKDGEGNRDFAQLTQKEKDVYKNKHVLKLNRRID